MNSTGRIAFFVPDLTGGGAERVMAILAQGFSDRGLNVDLLLIRATGPNLSLVGPGVRVVDLGTRRAILSVPPLASYISRARPSVMISALSHANMAALTAKRLSRSSMRLVVTLHNTFSRRLQQERGLRARCMPYLIERFYPWADEIVSVSHSAADDFVAATGIARERVTTIHNPVVSDEMMRKAEAPVSHPWFTPGGPPVIVAAGRLSKVKDFATLIRAFAEVRPKRESRLVILGEGPERQGLERQLARLGLQHSVSMPGFVNNPYAILKRAQLFVLSSRSEALPTVLIEALALGVPVVATDCKSGPREILRDGKYGKLVEVGDVDALADAIDDSLDQPDQVPFDEACKPYTKEAAVDAYLKVAGVMSDAS